jgi:pimeloyl-ACP methyl ester carboxylesterase
VVTDLCGAPAHLVGNSFGATIVLKLAVARPDLVASLAVHEPPLLGLLGDDPVLVEVRQRIGAVVAALQSGEAELGARQFVETIALGPGAWATLPAETRQTFVVNAPTWLDEVDDQEAYVLG